MDVFYLRPVYYQILEGPWYECSPVGKEKLRKYLATMCEDAGITERKTNHSLRKTGATALFSAGVPEKIIRDITGIVQMHWSCMNAHRLHKKELYPKYLCKAKNRSQKR